MKDENERIDGCRLFFFFFFFFSLGTRTSSQKIHRKFWTRMPCPLGVVSDLESLDTKRDFAVRDEFEPPFPLSSFASNRASRTRVSSAPFVGRRFGTTFLRRLVLSVAANESSLS